MGRRKVRTYEDPVEAIIGIRNLSEDAVISAIDKKYTFIPMQVSFMVEDGKSFAEIKKTLHIGDKQLLKALRSINKNILAKKLMEEKT